MTFIPTDGQITSLQALTAALTGGEVQEIVSSGGAAPATGQNGNSFKVTTAALAAFYSSFSLLNSELITAGATIGVPYLVQSTDTAVLFDKTLGSASFATCPLASSILFGHPILFKDIKGDANANNISVTFTGGQLCDGDSIVQITNNYGWFIIAPVPGGGSWYRLG